MLGNSASIWGVYCFLFLGRFFSLGVLGFDFFFLVFAFFGVGGSIFWMNEIYVFRGKILGRLVVFF